MIVVKDKPETNKEDWKPNGRFEKFKARRLVTRVGTDCVRAIHLTLRL